MSQQECKEDFGEEKVWLEQKQWVMIDHHDTDADSNDNGNDPGFQKWYLDWKKKIDANYEGFTKHEISNIIPGGTNYYAQGSFTTYEFLVLIMCPDGNQLQWQIEARHSELLRFYNMLVMNLRHEIGYDAESGNHLQIVALIEPDSLCDIGDEKKNQLETIALPTPPPKRLFGSSSKSVTETRHSAWLTLLKTCSQLKLSNSGSTSSLDIQKTNEYIRKRTTRNLIHFFISKAAADGQNTARILALELQSIETSIAKRNRNLIPCFTHLHSLCQPQQTDYEVAELP